MATKYGYVERTADSYINWAEVGKDMSDMLAETSRVREEKKAEIDKVNKEVLDYLATKAPQGESKTVRGMALEYSGNATQYMLDLDRKLKSGQLGLNDFLQARQNLSDGTERAFTMMSEYQQAYGDRMERFRKGENMLLEIANMEQIENFGDFSKSGLFINPYTGQVNLAMKEERDVDGKKVFAMSANPSKIMSVDAARNLLTTKYDRYDYGAATDTFAKQMGKQVEVLNRAGYSGTVEDITSRTYKDEKSKKLIFDFQEAERKGINALLANDYNRLSVLTDTDAVCSANGLEYRITFDPNDKAPEAVYVESDAQGKQIVKFTDTQKKDSFDFMRDDVRRKYDYVETAQRIPSGGGGGGGRGSGTYTKQLEAQKAWNQIFWGDASQKQSAVNSLLRNDYVRDQGIMSIDVKGSGITYTRKNSKGQIERGTIPFNSGQNNFGYFAQQGSLVSGLSFSPDEAVRKGGDGGTGLKVGDLAKITDFSGAMSEITTELTPEQAAAQEENKKAMASANVNRAADGIAKSAISIFRSGKGSTADKITTLTNLIGSLGFKISADPDDEDRVLVEAPNGKGVYYDVQRAFDSGAKSDADALSEFVRLNSTGATTGTSGGTEDTSEFN